MQSKYKVLNQILSQDEQTQLGLEFKGLYIVVDYDDYNTKTFFTIDISDESIRNIFKKIQNLKNSFDYYFVSSYLCYEIKKPALIQFANVSDMPEIFNDIEREEYKDKFILSEYFEPVRLSNHSKPIENIIYDEFVDICNNILTINNEFDLDAIKESIKILKKLETHLISNN